MASQVIFPGLGGTTSSSELVVKRGRRVLTPVSEQTIVVMVDNARRQLRGAAGDRLAELREAAAKRVRTMPTYPDSAEDAAEQTRLVEAFEGLQADTAAWSEGA